MSFFTGWGGWKLVTSAQSETSCFSSVPRAALNNNSNMAFSGCWERLTVAWTPQNASSDAESSCWVKQQLQLSTSLLLLSLLLLIFTILYIELRVSPTMVDWLKPSAVNHRWGHATITYSLLHAEKKDPSCNQDNRRSSFPDFLPSLLAKVFHYDPFFLASRPIQLHIRITTVDVWLTCHVYYALCLCGRTRWRARGRACTDTGVGGRGWR